MNSRLPRSGVCSGLPQWFVAVLFYCVEWLHRVAPTLLVSPMMLHYHLSAPMIAGIFSIYYWVYAFMQLPAGVLLDRYGPRVMLTMAAFLLTLGTLSYLASHAILGLCLARVLVGIGSAFGFIGCLKVAKVAVNQRAFPVLVSLTSSIGMLGALAGMEPLSKLIGLWGWRSSLLLAAGVSSLMAVLLWIFLKPKKTPDLPAVSVGHAWREQWEGLLAIMKKPIIWMVGLYAGLMQIPIIAYAELWAVPFLHTYDHLANVAAALVNSYVFWGIFVGGFFWGSLMGLPVCGKRLSSGSRRYICLVVAHIGIFVCLLSLLFHHHHHVRSLEMLSFGLGFFTVVMLISYTWASELAPKELIGSSVALVNMVGVVIGALFQWLISVFIKQAHLSGQYRHAFFPIMITSTIAFMMAICIVWHFATHKKSAEQSA